jgi:hypothetical protein
MVEAYSDIIRWSIQGGARIPLCTSGTIFRACGTWRSGAGTFHVASNRASKQICTVVPGSTWDGQFCLQTLFC